MDYETSSLFVMAGIGGKQGVANRRSRKHWHLIRFDPQTFIGKSFEDMLQEQVDKWAKTHTVVNQTDMDNAIRFMIEQVNNRAEYDWNGRVDVLNGVVRIPMVDIVAVDSSSRYSLTTSGLVAGVPEDARFMDDKGVNLTKTELNNYVHKRIGEWIYVSLLYSGGGLVDAMKVQQSRGAQDKNTVTTHDDSGKE